MIEDRRAVTESNGPLVLQRVTNGYIIRPPGDFQNNYMVKHDVVHVFPTLSLVVAFLQVHFPEQPDKS